MNKKFHLTTLERNWILYDVGNSAFILLVSTLMPIYFNYLAELDGLNESQYLAFWGYAGSVSTILVAVIGPICGTLADRKGFKKPIFSVCMLLGVIGCAFLGAAWSWLSFLVIFVLAKVGFSSSLVFYDAMLPDITQRERMDEVSSYGYAWGYIGSCIPFVACLLLVLSYESMGISMETAMALAFFLVAAWWLGGAVPLLRAYRQKHYVQARHAPVAESFRRLGNVFSELRRKPEILFFLLAFFFYIDGVYTVIDMATAYGTALGLDTTGLLLALLLRQVVAFPCSIFFGRLSRRMDARVILSVCIGAYFGIAVFAFWLESLTDFWILAVCVGMFQGTIQAISRSYYSKIIPAERAGEYFGIYDICGKGAAFTGTILVSVVSQVTHSTNAGVGSLTVMFLIGFLLFQVAAGKRTQQNA